MQRRLFLSSWGLKSCTTTLRPSTSVLWCGSLRLLRLSSGIRCSLGRLLHAQLLPECRWVRPPGPWLRFARRTAPKPHSHTGAAVTRGRRADSIMRMETTHAWLLTGLDHYPLTSSVPCSRLTTFACRLQMPISPPMPQIECSRLISITLPRWRYLVRPFAMLSRGRGLR